MQIVAARDLKQHTGEVIARVRGRKRLVLTVRGPVAVIVPIDQEALDEAISRAAQKIEDQGWLATAESAFALRDNDDDAVWDQVAVK